MSNQLDGELRAGSTQPFDDGYLGYDPRLSSQRFDSFSNFAESESVNGPAGDDSPIFTSNSYEQPIHVPYEFSSFSSEVDATSDGAILPPPVEMQPEQGSALREWTRLNAIRLEEKEMREKEVLSQISDEADEFKVDFYRKREITVETNKATNREKEKLFVASHEKFHAEAAGNYWKSIGELIPNEVPTIEKKKGKKDDEKKPSIVVINGPKPGKATDLSRMRQILLKLKHNTPHHLKPSPPAGPSTKADSATAPVATAVASSSEPVAVA
ncbi:clathrin light chain 2-like [Nicotiana tabacum]|uniref:Clathrin light chain n=1 Tax=Nicotiana tabacum TaxID=4097 RepID=A0A1S3XCL3_TOBAC|nr:PREDICTED: clathrin light chain 2-like [Nicotiana tabacum]